MKNLENKFMIKSYLAIMVMLCLLVTLAWI